MALFGRVLAGCFFTLQGYRIRDLVARKHFQYRRDDLSA